MIIAEEDIYFLEHKGGNDGSMRTGLLVACISTAALWGCASNSAPQAGTLAHDKAVFTSLLADHESLRRSVTELPDGIEATTESDDPAIAARLQDHVTAMKSRLHDGRRVRQWDPLYVALFDDGDLVRLDITPTEKGVRVRETSTDAKTVALIKYHAGVVTGYVEHGFEESAREHPVPAAAVRAR